VTGSSTEGTGPPPAEVSAEPTAQLTPIALRLTRLDWIATGLGAFATVATIVALLASGDADVPAVVGRAVGYFLLWWISFFGWGLLGQFLAASAVRQDEEAATAEIAMEKVTVAAGNDKTLEASVEAMSAILERLETSIDRMERAAALVPAALGILATVALARLNTDVSGFPVYMGLIAAAAALRALLDSILCLSRYRFAGVAGFGELWRVDRDYTAFQVGRINVLIQLYKFASYAATEKRQRLRLALFETGIAALSLYLFAGLGGFV